MADYFLVFITFKLIPGLDLHSDPFMSYDFKKLGQKSGCYIHSLKELHYTH